MVEDAKSLLSQVTKDDFIHIHCTANGVAHCLARFAFHIGALVYWFEEPPYFISNVLFEDCNK